MSNRSFGTVRQLRSGRWQARHLDPISNQRVTASETFATKAEAGRWLASAQADMERGSWVDPRAGNVAFAEFATAWVAEHPSLRPRTRENYEGNLRLHVLPALGEIPLNQITPSIVRRWHAGLSKEGVLSVATIAKCYRLLHAMMATAVADELIVRNPCVVNGASVDRSDERPVASLTQVKALADAVDPRYRALILTATLTGLRLGELLALRRRHVNLLLGIVTVDEQLFEMSDGTQHNGPPKTLAGKRTVAIPPPLVGELELHLTKYAGPGVNGFVFTAPEGGSIRRGNFRARVWVPAITSVGIPNFRFHDLRHTGNTLAAATGASTRELMARMGHSSSRAALIYQHATRERDQAIARSLGEMYEASRPSAQAAVHRVG
jgi:integrase